jgi:ligand-binding sensor domain-containing protein
MRYLLFLGLFFCLHNWCGAQLPAEVVVTRYNETNGIPNGRVTAVLQGKSGYLWLGTGNGLLSFDGYTFRQYINPGLSNAITRLAEDSSHQIWMSFLGGGFASFDPATGLFSNYKAYSAKDPSLGTGEIEMLLFDRKGQLWMGINQKGLVKAEPKQNRYTVYNLIEEGNLNLSPAFRNVFNSVYNATEDEQGVLWLATHDGLYRFTPQTGKMEVLRYPYQPGGNQRYDLFRCIYQQHDTLWLGSFSGGISRYCTTTGQWTTWLPDSSKARSQTTNIITDLTPKSDHEFWVCSADLGLGIFNRQQNTFSFFSQQARYTNVPTGEWMYATRDKDQNIWGLHRDGLYKVQVPDYKFVYTPLPATHNNIDERNYILTDWYEDDNFRLVGTGYADGLQVTDKRNNTRKALPIFLFPQEESVMDIRHIYRDSRRVIWIVTRDVIYTFDTTRLQLVKAIQLPAYSPDKPSHSFTRMTEDKEGNLWFGTKRKGIFKYNRDGSQLTWYNNRSDAFHFLETSFVLDVITDTKGRVWMAGPYGFLSYIDPKTHIPVPLQTHKGDSLPLPGNKTSNLFTDHAGNVWAGTYYGLCYFDCNGPTPVLKKIFRVRNGLVSDFVYSMQEDAAGNMWCLTEAGICMIDRRDDHITVYNAMDGLTKGSNGQRIICLPGNQLQLLTNGGYYHIRNETTAPQREVAPLLITRMTVNDKEFYYTEALNHSGTVTLHPGQNFFSFEFAAINFSRPDKQQYAYMLEGFDKDWIAAGNRRFVSYTNVPGGHYVFRIKLVVAEGPGDTPAIALPLYIQTPFYKTLFFYALLVLIIGVLVYWLYRNRLQHHRALHQLHSRAQLLEKEKALVMYEGLKQQLNPHFLFNSLTSLSGLIQTNQQMADDFLSRMSKIYRYILQNRDSDTVPLQEEVRFVSNYIQLQQTRFKKGLQVNITIDEDYDHRKVAPVVLQNLVENAIKHNIIDVDTPLVIDIFCEEEYLVVRNNLQKKAFVETSNKQGLLNMKALYRYLTSRPILIEEDKHYFTIKIPLL